MTATYNPSSEGGNTAFAGGGAMKQGADDAKLNRTLENLSKGMKEQEKRKEKKAREARDRQNRERLRPGWQFQARGGRGGGRTGRLLLQQAQAEYARQQAALKEALERRRRAIETAERKRQNEITTRRAAWNGAYFKQMAIDLKRYTNARWQDFKDRHTIIREALAPRNIVERVAGQTLVVACRASILGVKNRLTPAYGQNLDYRAQIAEIKAEAQAGRRAMMGEKTRKNNALNRESKVSKNVLQQDRAQIDDQAKRQEQQLNETLAQRRQAALALQSQDRSHSAVFDRAAIDRPQPQSQERSR